MSSLRDFFSRPIVRGILFFFVVLVIFFAVVFFFFWSKLDLIQYDEEVETMISQEHLDEAVVDIGDLEISDTVPQIPDDDVHTTDDVQNILLIGTDERTFDFSDASRADCMILVSINKDQNTVRLVSFERAIGVPILEGELAGEYDLLTHVFRWGGADLLMKTIEHCFKIELDQYVRLNFTSVEMIVDAIGGIEIELTGEEAGAINEDLYEGNWLVGAGKNQLNGREALSFARLRKIDSDWKRVARQRKVILAVVDRLKDTDLLTLNDLADTVLPMIQTDMSKVDIAELLLYAPTFFKSDFDQMTIPKQGTYGGIPIRNNSYGFGVDYEINNDLLYRFLYEGATSEELLAE